jgi:nitroreductase
MPAANSRESAHDIDPMFLDRWSPRAFTEATMTEDELLTILEAARWAPSTANYQPWRFIYALRGGPHWDRFVSLLAEGNQVWAKNAAALVLIVSRQVVERDGEKRPHALHAFDAGTSWGHLAIQAHLKGLHAHGMGGIKRDEIKEAFGIGEDYVVQAAVAIGVIAPADTLPEPLRAREVPSQRRPLSELAFNGKFVAD